MSQIYLLHNLQALDTDIQSNKVELSGVLTALKGTDALGKAQESAEVAAVRVNQHQAIQKKREIELDAVNRKRKELEERLYSGIVKNSKELVDLQKGVEALKRRASKIEDQVLEALMAVEEAQEVADSADSTFKTLDAEWTAKKARLTTQKQELALYLSKALQKRKAQAVRIEAPLLQQYEKIRRKMRGIAVVELVRASACGGCATTLPATKIKNILQGQLTYCGQCGRIIIPAQSVI